MSDVAELEEAVLKQIEIEEDYTEILKKGVYKLKQTKLLMLVPLFLFVLVSVHAAVANYNPGAIIMMWIVASFLLYMIYFFFMMIPSLGTDTKQNIFNADFRENIKQFLKIADHARTFHKNKVTFLEFFWNAYLVNTKPIVRGFAMLYITDLTCALILWASRIINFTTFLILTAQIVVILILYWRITKAVPGTPGFFTSIPLAETEDKKFSFKKLKVLGIIAFSMMFTALIMIGAMLIPGMTLSEYIGELPLVPSSYPVLVAATIILQFAVIRYLQGVDSRNLMTELNKTHLSVLKDDLLPRVKSATAENISDLKREFIVFTMNKLMVQEFFGRFPAYSLMPNFFIVLSPVVREILDEKGDEKSIKEGLRDIL
ncbi:MAG: hypothetical protein Q4Q53_06420 [Methanocorpusculum sp.]|nr:hypothetical protein [Methanocorpusculum sp.]